MWDGWNEETDVGDPPFFAYFVYYKLTADLYFEQLSRDDQLAPAETITGLTPDTDYVFGVSAVRPGVGGGGTRLEVAGSTECSREFYGV